MLSVHWQPELQQRHRFRVNATTDVEWGVAAAVPFPGATDGSLAVVKVRARLARGLWIFNFLGFWGIRVSGP